MKNLDSLQIISLQDSPVFVPVDGFHHFLNRDRMMIRNDP
jgi:hypothetical protein